MPNSTTEQAQRRAAIEELLSTGPAATQRSLVDALRTRGLDATQSSVSRDLKEIGAIKTAAGYELPNPHGSTANEPESVSASITSLAEAPSCQNVVHPSPKTSILSAVLPFTT